VANPENSAPSELSDSEADNQLIGAFLGGMIAFDQSITNQLMDSHIDTAIDWATRFQKFYDWVARYNRDTQVQWALDFYYWDRKSIGDTIEHLESMKMTGR
jgi:hypothetical protein